MTATEFKQKAFDSVKDEISGIEKLMVIEAEKGNLSLMVDGLTPACKLYLIHNGFEIKIHLEAGKEIGASNKSIIKWG